jgi:hypothetical protein
MTRFIYNEDLAAAESKLIIELNITGGMSEGFNWSYSDNTIIIGKNVLHIEVKLKNHTTALAAITNYASTGITDQQRPINKSSFSIGRDAQSASFAIELLPNQLLNFGLFVELTIGDTIVTLFCDPQASNDPIKTTSRAC